MRRVSAAFTACLPTGHEGTSATVREGTAPREFDWREGTSATIRGGTFSQGFAADRARPAPVRLACVVVLALVLLAIGALLPSRGSAMQWVAPDRVSCQARPWGLVNGINIDKTCQKAYFVRKGRVVRVVAASTGKPGYETRSGYFRVYRRLDRWAESKLYPGAMMYRPMFFSGGQAIHGSVTDYLVKPYPASHGCVRMHRHDIDWLWRNGWGVGTRVHVFRR